MSKGDLIFLIMWGLLLLAYVIFAVLFKLLCEVNKNENKELNKNERNTNASDNTNRLECFCNYNCDLLDSIESEGKEKCEK